MPSTTIHEFTKNFEKYFATQLAEAKPSSSFVFSANTFEEAIWELRKSIDTIPKTAHLKEMEQSVQLEVIKSTIQSKLQKFMDSPTQSLEIKEKIRDYAASEALNLNVNTLQHSQNKK